MIFIKLSAFSALIFSVSLVWAQGGTEGENPLYNKKLQSVSTSLTKVKDGKFQLKELIKSMKAKKVVLDEEGNDVTLESIVDTYKELRKNTEEYNKKVSDLKYKFPEKGELKERRYMPIRVQSIEEIEQEIGIDGLLSKLKKKVEKKYRVFQPTEEEDGGEQSLLRERARRKAEAREAKPKLRLEK